MRAAAPLLGLLFLAALVAGYARQPPAKDSFCVPHKLNILVCKEVKLSWKPLLFLEPGPTWWVNR